MGSTAETARCYGQRYKIMSIVWPAISNQQIEEHASNLRQQALSFLNMEQTSEVPVEQIAEMYLGYELDFVEGIDGYPDDVIGGIDFETNTILVNSAIESHIGRYSFTIAHEIGHHVLHREEFYRQSKSKHIMCRGMKERPIEEMQADRFAESLLMPANLVKEHFRKVRNKNIFKPENPYIVASKVIESTGLNNVSVKAMVVRLNHLELITKNPLFNKIYKLFSS